MAYPLLEISFHGIVEQSSAGIYVIQGISVRECDLRRGDGYALEGLIGKLVGLVGMSERVREPGSSLACCATPCGTA